MANQYGLFWNSNNSDRLYDADSLSEWLRKFFTTGVFNGDLEVLSTGGMDVTVQTGYANINGKVRLFDTADTITIAPASGTYPRIDTIVVERNDTNRAFTIEYVVGDYSGTTPSPTAPVRTANVYQIVLAQIYVGAGVTELTQADVTDTRPDNDLCGWVVGTVDRVDVAQMTAQAQADFEAWYDSMKDQLSEDAAGHLQNEITALDTRVDAVEATAKSVIDVTLATASWSSGTYTITDSAIDPDRIMALTYPATLTSAEYTALQDAQIRVTAVSAGSMTLQALGTVPTTAIPIQIVIWG